MEWNLSHSEGTWLCDNTFLAEIYPILRGPDCDCNLWIEIYHILRGPDYMIIFPVKNLSHSEGNWLCDYTFQPKIYPFWGTWLCDHNFQPKIYPILRGTDYVIMISSQKSISFWVHLTMWLYFPAKNLSHSEWTWPCNYTSQPKIHPILKGPD